MIFHSQLNMESHKIPWFQTTNQTSIYRGYPIVMFDFHTGYHKKNHATWSIPRIGIRFITRIFSQYNPVHVVKTMSFLPPVTGNGKFIPTNFMVTGGWCVRAFMALFLPTSQMGKKNEKNIIIDHQHPTWTNRRAAEVSSRKGHGTVDSRRHKNAVDSTWEPPRIHAGVVFFPSLW